jgi:hypothetical protein
VNYETDQTLCHGQSGLADGTTQRLKTFASDVIGVNKGELALRSETSNLVPEESKMSKGGRPPWLFQKKPDPERHYDTKPNIAAAVLWMFRASANGLSDQQIAKTIPSRFRAPKWAGRSIANILTDPTVKGRVVDDTLFQQVQAARAWR